ncbi:hypothetical protein [Mycobacterium sp. IDR2000157661]|uniref:hypothetical protein n=1 Tax=Mycobacterium sp. IDR2000157661 TaxID=2867005 RepID=UPI001EEE41AA|nr:hypothetical protein [Mycobacterium sp. IDR2000157661]ULE34728.1 hypothetical protein K3G64_09145 [Mycobacterium sp. IDR2000157661]
MDTDDGADPATERVRRELALLGRDGRSAPAVPAEVTARIGATLRGAPPAHSMPRPRLRRRQLLGLLIGLAAALAGVVVGASMLAHGPSSRFPAGPTAHSITVSQPAAPFPLTEPDITALLTTAPAYGPLSDEARRRACLAGLGYPPATPLLGARPIAGAGPAGVVLVLPGNSPETVTALLVSPDCGAGHSGSSAETEVARP